MCRKPVEVRTALKLRPLPDVPVLVAKNAGAKKIETCGRINLAVATQTDKRVLAARDSDGLIRDWRWI